MRAMLAMLAAALAAAPAATAAAARPWLADRAAPPSQRAAALLARMNATEKLVLLQGSSGPGIGYTAAIPRLGIPQIHLEDGPSGVADWQTNVTTWPSSMTMAASWDAESKGYY